MRNAIRSVLRTTAPRLSEINQHARSCNPTPMLFQCCCVAATFLMVCFVVIKNDTAYGQTTSSSLDDLFIRELYRHRPKLADELERALNVVAPRERDSVIESMAKRLQEEKNLLTDLSPEVRPLDVKDRFENNAIALGILIDMYNSQGVPGPLAFTSLASQEAEDEVIKAINSNYKELYDSFRWIFGENIYNSPRAGDWAARLHDLKQINSEEYNKRMHKLVDLLHAYRAGQSRIMPPDQTPNGSIIPELAPNPSSNDAKMPQNERPVKPTVKCKKGGGLVEAMDCVGRRISEDTDKDHQNNARVEKPTTNARASSSASWTEPKTGTTTTSVRNPDGTRTVTKTDKNGKELSKETVGKSPPYAVSIDTRTGIATTSVGNSDGTRTLTRTDKNGNVLSKEIVR